jgi:glutamine---fructose-6-phosphate transaminase (isomerizing)
LVINFNYFIKVYMCGIVGAVAQRNILPVLLEGLTRLEYRGYDSCGIAFYGENGLDRFRSTQRIAELASQVGETSAFLGISHTRWATHGKPSTDNAHPHWSSRRVAVVHNGIIENYEVLRTNLLAKGYTFESQTDTEAIVHLIDSLYVDDLLKAVQAATKQLKGAYAIAVIHQNEPNRMVGARAGSPLLLGLGEHALENFLASDAMALAETTHRIIYLEEGDVVDVRADSACIYDATGCIVQRVEHHVEAATGKAEMGPYSHYMQKEIFEQPQAIADTLEGIEGIAPSIFGEKATDLFPKTERILILACGTSYYAGLTAAHWLETMARIPVTVEIASEFRYRNPVSVPNTLVVVISQSGETADTLAALRYAKVIGMKHSLTICNVATSAMVRECDLAYLTRAGAEVSVASTKAFTTQLCALFLLALTFAKQRGFLSSADELKHLNSARHLPTAIRAVLALEPTIQGWASQFAVRENALFLGRGLHYPIALEGALKLKEISYIHAEAYPAGELKHGPLSLITNTMPVVTVAPNDALLDKLRSNMQEVKARDGVLYVLADTDTHIESESGIHVLRMPEHYGALSPILHTVALQLLAYHTALLRGTDVDKPRNLAKSVTVE